MAFTNLDPTSTGRQRGASGTGFTPVRSAAASRRPSLSGPTAAPDLDALGVTIPRPKGPTLTRVTEQFFRTVFTKATGAHPHIYPAYVDGSGEVKRHFSSNDSASTITNKDGVLSPNWSDLGNYAHGFNTLTPEARATRDKAASFVGVSLDWQEDQVCTVHVPEKVSAAGVVAPPSERAIRMPLARIQGGFVNRDYPSGIGVLNTGINTAMDPVVTMRNKEGQMMVLSGTRTDEHILNFRNLEAVLATAGISSVPISVLNETTGLSEVKLISIAGLSEALSSIHIDFAAGMKDNAQQGERIKAFLSSVFGPQILQECQIGPKTMAAYKHGSQANALITGLLIQLSKLTVAFAENQNKARSSREKIAGLAPILEAFSNPTRAILGGGMVPPFVKEMTDPAYASLPLVEQKMKLVKAGAVRELVEEGGFDEKTGPKQVEDQFRRGITEGTVDVDFLTIIPSDDQRNTDHVMVTSGVIFIDVTDDDEFQAIFRRQKGESSGFKLRLADGSDVELAEEETNSGDDVMNSKWVVFDPSKKWFASHGDIGVIVHAHAVDKNQAKIETLRQQRDALVLQLAIPVAQDAKPLAKARYRESQATVQEKLAAADAKIKQLTRLVATDGKVISGAGYSV